MLSQDLYQTIAQDIQEEWEKNVLPTLMDYIRIPCKSPHFDPQWAKNGFIQTAVEMLANWCRKQSLADFTVDVLEIENRTPLLLVDIKGQLDETVLLYGHLDKQPEMTGWNPDLAPWTPVRTQDKLYGRGGADDGYAVFSAISAICALERYHIPHARCLVLIESSEESGSYDLPFYLDYLQTNNLLSEPSLVIGLDGGSGNYDQLWDNISLRGILNAELTVAVLKEGVHSGLGSGVVPSAFMILRQLMDRIEDDKTGTVLVEECFEKNVPSLRLTQTEETAQLLDTDFIKGYPFLSGVQTLSQNTNRLLLQQTWEPQLSTIGIEGLPALQNAGNVTLPYVTVSLSFRLPPTVSPEKAAMALKNRVESNPPFGAHVSFKVKSHAQGWNAPAQQPWLREAIDHASLQAFGQPCAYLGQGGSIPFMSLLGQTFPKAQFLITGVLGPHSNAHGPNEFLHLPFVKKLTACVSFVLAAHYHYFSRRL